MTASLSCEQVSRFAYAQGRGKNLLDPPAELDDADTTSGQPPVAALGARGVPIGHDTATHLDVPFPHGRAAAAHDDLLGQVLVAALGLQRREPQHHYADHRSIASGRAMYPVHAFVRDRRGLRYFDAYRRALVDVDAATPQVDGTDDGTDDGTVGGTLDGGTRHGGDIGVVEVVLAARYGDLPVGYGRTRGSVTEAELGIAARSVCECAAVFGLRTDVEVCGPPVTHAAADLARDLTCAGPAGTWSAPVVVRVHDVPSARSVTLPGTVPRAAVRAENPDTTAGFLRGVSASRFAPLVGSSPDRAVPHTGLCAGGTVGGTGGCRHKATWATVLAQRSAGRSGDGRHGFALRPHRVEAACEHALFAAAAACAPGPFQAVAARVGVRVAVGAGGPTPAGVYGIGDGGRAVAERRDDTVMRLLGERAGQTSSGAAEIGTRHAGHAVVLSADVDALLRDLGPGAWATAQLWCGWLMHGLCLAAAAHGLVARPTRSYDETTLAHTLGLTRKDEPMFMIIVGRSAYDPPVLDLRP